MENTFNPVEIAEDKDAAIQQLRHAITQRNDQINQYSTELGTVYERLRSVRAEHDQLSAYFEDYKVATRERCESLEDKYNMAIAALQTQPRSIDAVVNTYVTEVVSAYVTELVSSLLEGNDIRKLVEAAVDNHIELTLENGAFNTEPIDKAIEQYMEHCDIDCDEAVTKAIEEALVQVYIKFNR